MSIALEKKCSKLNDTTEKDFKSMKKQFKVSYYLRSNYENKEGKNPIMVRIILDGEMINLGTSQLSVKKSIWSNATSRAKGRTAEAVALNASLDALSASLHELFRKHEYDDYLTAESFKAKFLREEKEFSLFSLYLISILRV